MRRKRNQKDSVCAITNELQKQYKYTYIQASKGKAPPDTKVKPLEACQIAIHGTNCIGDRQSLQEARLSYLTVATIPAAHTSKRGPQYCLPEWGIRSNIEAVKPGKYGVGQPPCYRTDVCKGSPAKQRGTCPHHRSSVHEHTLGQANLRRTGYWRPPMDLPPAPATPCFWGLTGDCRLSGDRDVSGGWRLSGRPKSLWLCGLWLQTCWKA